MMNSQSFRSLWVGQGLANFGDVFYVVGLIAILYSISKSAFYLALLPFITTFGRFLGGVISPILFNRFPLKSLLVGSQVSKTVLLLLLALGIHVTSELNLFVILTLGAFIAFLDGWALPATQAMLPRLVHERELVKANSWVSGVQQLTQLGGWGLGGVLVAAMGGPNILLFTFILYVCSSVLMTGLVDPTPFQKSRREKAGDVLKEGWNIIWSHPLFRTIHIVIFLEAIAYVVWIAAILYVFVTEVLQATEAWWGYINTSFFIGLLLGSVVCSKYATLIERHMKQVILVASFSVSGITFWFGLNEWALLALALSFFIGVVEQMKSIGIDTLLQKEGAPEKLPKIYGAQSTLISFTFGVSSLLFGAIADMWDVRVAFYLSSFLLLSASIYWTVKQKHLPASIEKSEQQVSL
jgi:MFS transporter, DHA3 family, macrolide efflux protein